jgi:hypothetical protein
MTTQAPRIQTASSAAYPFPAAWQGYSFAFGGFFYFYSFPEGFA